jgi:hypothetical protein
MSLLVYIISMHYPVHDTALPATNKLFYCFVEILQSHFIPTMSHWSSTLPVCFPSQGTRVQIPWGVLL